MPTVQQKDWIKTPVDLFILSRLEKEKLLPSPEASRATLIRRLSFDLLGLPPTPQEVTAFENDTNPNAYEKLVDRMLASLHYGERSGRHWLDVAGYADSNGYFNADSDRPLAYKYRDYVVRAFNADKPFDQFIREQIAGDELGGYVPDGDVTPEMVELLTATHFLRNAPDGTGESDGNEAEVAADRYAVFEGNVQIIGSALLGLTVQCARCHDHKFEQIATQEYYQLQAILRPVYDLDHWIKPGDRQLKIGTRVEREKNKKELQKYERELAAMKESLQSLIKPFLKVSQLEALDGLADRDQIEKALATAEKDRDATMKALLKKHEAILQISDEVLRKRFPVIATVQNSLKDAISKLETERPKDLPQLAVVTERGGETPAHHVLVRGNYMKPGKPAEAGVPAILSIGKNEYCISPGASKTSGRRLAFAKWLTSPEHPMVARLMVNRIWQNHFGVGLVVTPDNFGVTGARPSHPELLDYLASEFVKNGWSIKSLHRLIVNSATYRQGSAARQSSFAKDPENVLLWRYPMRRLDAESIRDGMLRVSGEMDAAIGGPYVPVKMDATGQVIVDEAQAGAKRRSLYLQQRRTQPAAVLEVFDGAQMNPNCSRRIPSTVSLQSLTLLNSEFARQRGQKFAERLAKEAGADPAKRIELAFRLALGRSPKTDERAAAEEFLAAQKAAYAGKADGGENAWADFCQMVLASNGFLYVD